MGQADADPSQSRAADELFSNINMFSLRSAESTAACPVEWWLWGRGGKTGSSPLVFMTAMR